MTTMQTVDAQGQAPGITTGPSVIHDTRGPVSSASPNLWERIAIACRARGYSLSTERTYVHWAKAFAAWHGRRHPRTMGGPEVQAYLNHLAVDREVAPSTAKQALSALLFLYRHVLGQDLPWLTELQYPRGKPRLPSVLSQDETRRLLAACTGTPGLVLRLLYGTGMRMMEVLRLRVQDVDIERRVITIRHGKGDKDRTTMLPESLVAPMRAQLVARRRLHDIDLAAGVDVVGQGTGVAAQARCGGEVGHAAGEFRLRIGRRTQPGAVCGTGRAG